MDNYAPTGEDMAMDFDDDAGPWPPHDDPHYTRRPLPYQPRHQRAWDWIWLAAVILALAVAVVSLALAVA